MKSTYLISYDISSNKLRKKCADYLINKGAKRTQKSVFIIIVDEQKVLTLFKKLEKLKEVSDLLMMVRLDGKQSVHKLSGYGFPFSVYQGKENLIFI